MNEARQGLPTPDGLRLSPREHLGESADMSLLPSNGSCTPTSDRDAALSTSTGPTRYDTGGLDDTPAGITDQDALL
ncbi:hypothetical protein CTheo_9269 [Ceratobasidium theobromae]|uniref:Uncharacterized protein n=1 Tax=Ceratobasidium theobromae TaxID=1582974 RepID=A0A5N5PH59_9AGAM|nr:hypothetical protein CTheo_9269 [Ceratobasidium theobromae]